MRFRLQPSWLVGWALLGTSFVAVLIMLAQTPLHWPFELFASYQPQFLFSGIFVCLLAVAWRPRSALVTAILVCAAALPFLTFGKYQAAGTVSCARQTCLTTMTANLWGEQPALERIAEIAVQENVDLISLNHMPGGIDEQRLRGLFPSFETVFIAVPEELGGERGKPIALISRISPTRIRGELPTNTGGRALITADFLYDGKSLRTVLAHTVIPLSMAGMRKRDNLLEAANRYASETDTAILMGDLNLTPWVPTFRALSGERAGNPRFRYSWDARKPLSGIIIDHIVFSGELSVVDARVLDSIGSDHRPVLARFAFKAQ